MSRVTGRFGPYLISATSIEVTTGGNYVEWSVRWGWNAVAHSRHDLMLFFQGMPGVPNVSSYDFAPATDRNVGERVVYGRFRHNKIGHDSDIKTPQEGFDRIHMYMVLWEEHRNQEHTHAQPP